MQVSLKFWLRVSVTENPYLTQQKNYVFLINIPKLVSLMLRISSKKCCGSVCVNVFSLLDSNCVTAISFMPLDVVKKLSIFL